jgi:thiamine pyrophosphate-dependent acetolactate synthase large subunit-like protein
MLVYEAIAITLKDLGVDTAFGLMGDGNMRIITHMAQRCGIRYYSAKHEMGAFSMADAYARITGKVGVCTVTQGPGLTNTITPLVEAVKARTPILLLTGATPTGTRWHNQYIDQPALVTAVGAGYEPFRGVATVISDLARAMHRAVLERRPILFSLPTNVQELEVELPERPILPIEIMQRIFPDPEAVKKIADLVQVARRPVILGGRGAARSGARNKLEELGERMGALFATSAMAKGLFSKHAFDLGVAGGFSTRLARHLLGEADLILAFGASLNQWTTHHETLFSRSAALIQCDITPEALGAKTRVTLGVVGDAAATALALHDELATRGFQQIGFRTEAIRKKIANYRPEDEFEDESTEEQVDPRSLILRLKQLLPQNYTLVIDGGHCTGFPIAYLDVPDAAGCFFPVDSQALGIGVGGAVGAAIARPDRCTVLVIGDGAMMMGLMEIDAAVRYNLPVLMIVMNDAAYGAEIYFLKRMGMTSEYARYKDPDIAAIARGMGAQGLTVHRLSELEHIQSWLAKPTGPLVIDCKVNPEVRGEWFKVAFSKGSMH